MSDGMTVAIAAFMGSASLIGLVGLLVVGRRDPVETRIEDFRGQSKTAPEPVDNLLTNGGNGRLTRLLSPANHEGRKQIGDRLVQAGIYRRNSLPAYLLMKSLLIALPVSLGFAASSAGLLTFNQAIVSGLITGIIGTIAPGFWLDAQRSRRQTTLRRALPDALDVIIVCVEGGLSLPASFARVASELRGVHPLLAAEMKIVQREIQLGRSTGEALKNFANRFDLEELRGLASVVLQAERFGASVVKALRVHADSLREKRLQRAEEMAAKAAVKLLFPTVFFIFPALFVVILGPAAFDIIELMNKLNNR